MLVSRRCEFFASLEQEQFCADDRCLLNWTRVNYVILN